MIEDLLMVGEGVDLSEREALPGDVGSFPPAGTVAIVRAGRLLPPSEPVEEGDRLLGVVSNGSSQH
jgi:hypothetical protein